MAKRRVSLWGQFKDRFVLIEERATEGATVGTDLYWPDGSIVTESEITGGSASGPSSTTSIASTIWRLIREIPANIVSLAALAGTGFAVRISSADAWANREITGTFGRIDISDGDGVAGNPVIDLGNWPTVRNNIGTGLEYIIPEGEQLIVFREFVLDGGDLIIEGELVIIE
jgi:hypothetical protein